MELSIFTITIVSILSGLLSSMWVWSSSWYDIRLSINDFYMSILMTGWMFFFHGITMKYVKYIWIGVIVIIFSLIVIRLQLFVTPDQYLLGMIPHHSMAVLMSEKIIDKYGPHILDKLPLNIVHSQNREIVKMKRLLIT